MVAALLLGMLLLCCCADNSPPDNDAQTLPELVIGSDYYEPFVYRDEYGNFAGIDVDLATEVCRNIGYAPKFVHIDWTEKKTLLESGEIDCLWGCFSVNGRETLYSWTLPYMNSIQVVAVPFDSDITSVADLEGKRLAVQSTTKPDEIFSSEAGKKDPSVPNLKRLDCFPDISYAFAAVNNGYVDAVAGHELVLRNYMQTSSAKLKILSDPLLEVQVGVAFLTGTHTDVIEKINQTLYLLKNNGYLTQLITNYGLNPEMYIVDYGQEN